MASKDRRLRRIDEQRPFVGGADILSTAGEPAQGPLPYVGPPRSLRVEAGSATVLYSAVTPAAAVNLTWFAPEGAAPDSYLVQWSTSATFAANNTTVSAGRNTRVGVSGLPTNTLVYFRVQGIVRGVAGAWSNTASTTTPQDLAPPAAPTALTTSWSGLTGDLTLTWTNPTSANFRDVRVRIFASNGGALLRETFSATGRFVYTRAMNYADTSGSPDASVYLVLTARSWSNVYSATDLTGSATLSAPSAPAGLTVDFSGPDLSIAWTAGAVAGYRLTLDGVAREVGLSNRYTYTYQQNAAEHSGTADPSISVSLVALDALGQASTAATTTATNAAPAATTITASGLFFTVALDIAPSPALDLRDYRVRVYRNAALVRTIFTPNTQITYQVEDGDGAYTFDVTVYDVFGQASAASAQTASAPLRDPAAYIADLREEAIYSDSLGTDPATLKAALADDITSSGGVTYNAAAGWRWTQVFRERAERYKSATVATSAGIEVYLGFSMDGTTWLWFYGGTPTMSRWQPPTWTVIEATAQAGAVMIGAGGGVVRIDLPIVQEARYVRLYHRRTDAAITLREWYPATYIRVDQLQAGGIEALHIGAEAITADKIAAGAVTAAKISVSQLSAISADMGTITAGTVTGATIRTAASDPRVELTSTGLRSYNSSGDAVVSILTANNGQIRMLVGTSSLIGTSDPAALAWGDNGLIVGTAYNGGAIGLVNEVQITATDELSGRGIVRLTGEGLGGPDAFVEVRGGRSTGITAAQITLGADAINLNGSLTTDNLNVGGVSGAGTGVILAKRTAGTATDLPTILGLYQGYSGAAAAGFGLAQTFFLKSSTTDDRAAGQIRVIWNDATDASRKSDLILFAYDTAAREGLRIRGGGSAAQIGFFGVTPANRQSIGGAAFGATAVETLVNNIRSALIALGLCQT